MQMETFRLPCIQPPDIKNIIRTKVDAQFVLSLGAKVNINKCRLSIV